jgi:diaminohydroxyphosphoribosylaminopyrimidine deaminase/5-amino-6-(5-phosphoribosylamino)uracil reductase
MRRAVTLAEQGRGSVAPNPCVGAVLTLDDAVVATGFHRRYGADHAEVEAIAAARENGIDLKQATLWVTLEPCNHQGRTPPCTRAILEAGIPRVMIGTRDPNPDVAGGGVEYLRSRSVQVETGILEPECRDLIRDFCIRRREHRPYLILKLAATLDGKIGTRNRDSIWVTGPRAREAVHRLRAAAQAVCVGGTTFQADNPGLDCRSSDCTGCKQPLAVIVSSTLPENPERFQVLKRRPSQSVFLTSQAAAASNQAAALSRLGVRMYPLPPRGETGLDLFVGMKDLLRSEDCYTVLCEGGGRLAGSLMEQGLVDEFNLFLAPKVLGDELGVAAVSGLRPLRMAQTRNFRLVKQRSVGPDLWLTLYPDD